MNPINAFVATRRDVFLDNRLITFRFAVGVLCFGGEDRKEVDGLVARVLFVGVRDRSFIVLDGTVFSTTFPSLFLFLIGEIDLIYCRSLSPSSPPSPSALLRLLIVSVFKAVLSPGSKNLTVWRWRLGRFP